MLPSRGARLRIFRVLATEYGSLVEVLYKFCLGNHGVHLETFEHIDVRETRPGVLKLSGELDIVGVPEVQSHVASITGGVTIDCADLTFIDAAGLGLLVELHQGCESRGVKLVIADPPERMTMLLGITGLDTLFNLQGSRAS
jgi:anti-sigma B factor antagonist